MLPTTHSHQSRTIRRRGRLAAGPLSHRGQGAEGAGLGGEGADGIRLGAEAARAASMAAETLAKSGEASGTPLTTTVGVAFTPSDVAACLAPASMSA